MEITFLGAAETVTGSRFLVKAGGATILVDCGLFQGEKRLRLRNWNRLPFDPRDVDAVVLTHAHIDHAGFLPVLVREGFDGPIHCTAPTRDLCRIMLPDSGRIQEEDARYANEKGFSKHRPALPLYTEADAERVLPLLKGVGFGEGIAVGEVQVDFRPAGHILGAASARLRFEGKSLLFSGDLGSPGDVLLPDPEPPGEHDWIVMESTYGDRDREEVDVVDALEAVVVQALDRGGMLLIPSFAVGRAQKLVYCLEQIFRRGDVERVPVYLDSPMAVDVTQLYETHCAFHTLSRNECAGIFGNVRLVRSTDESKALNGRRGPMVIISASGMLTGGRILHHIRQRAPDRKNTILLPGYQAPGTRGAALADGADRIKIHGKRVEIEAQVKQVDVFSAHADQRELLDWIGKAPAPPQSVFLVHGDPEASDALRRLIRDRHGFDVHIPEHRETVRRTKARKTA